MENPFLFIILIFLLALAVDCSPFLPEEILSTLNSWTLFGLEPEPTQPKSFLTLYKEYKNKPIQEVFKERDSLLSIVWPLNDTTSPLSIREMYAYEGKIFFLNSFLYINPNHEKLVQNFDDFIEIKKEPTNTIVLDGLSPPLAVVVAKRIVQKLTEYYKKERLLKLNPKIDLITESDRFPAIRTKLLDLIPGIYEHPSIPEMLCLQLKVVSEEEDIASELYKQYKQSELFFPTHERIDNIRLIESPFYSLPVPTENLRIEQVVEQEIEKLSVEQEQEPEPKLEREPQRSRSQNPNLDNQNSEHTVTDFSSNKVNSQSNDCSEIVVSTRKDSYQKPLIKENATRPPSKTNRQKKTKKNKSSIDENDVSLWLDFIENKGPSPTPPTHSQTQKHVIEQQATSTKSQITVIPEKAITEGDTILAKVDILLKLLIIATSQSEYQLADIGHFTNFITSYLKSMRETSMPLILKIKNPKFRSTDKAVKRLSMEFIILLRQMQVEYSFIWSLYNKARELSEGEHKEMVSFEEHFLTFFLAK